MLQKAKNPFVLFQRAGTKNWSMRYSMGGRQIRKSLETSDESEAYRRANEIWHEQNYRLKNGLSIQQYAFCDVAEEFIKKIEAEAERGERSEDHAYYWPPKIRRFLVGYFNEQPIDRITSPDLERYLDWRKTYWTSGPGAKIEKIRCEGENGRIYTRPVAHKVPASSTIKGEMVIVRALFDQAVRWGYCKPIIVPAPHAFGRRIDNRRPGFTPEEYTKLIETALKRLEGLAFEAKPIKAKDGRMWIPKKTNMNVIADRSRLYGYIQLMANSGMRPTEARNLKWGNILGYKNSTNAFEDVRLQVRGKGKHGDIVPLYGVIPALNLLWQWFEHHLGREPNDDDPVLANEDGTSVASFNKGFKELLKAAGLERDYRRVPRTTYSLRHYYISKMIAQGVSVHDVARNTRTSIEMIDKHYAQVSTEQIKDKLRAGQKL